ncbi:MAG: DUF5679 domain-containing protein [Candidatus Thalassarchaeum sp.]|nr:DUF5679 domain-containing protein [Candidatus Thalassarchaeum sp.]MEC9350999.1 DUF5679 domain-containing protein [Candidatus Thermoplasmatota archaeon]
MGDGVSGFCMKCKQSIAISNPVYTTMSNGRRRVSGDCSSNTCDGRISKIVS